MDNKTLYLKQGPKMLHLKVPVPSSSKYSKGVLGSTIYWLGDHSISFKTHSFEAPLKATRTYYNHTFI